MTATPRGRMGRFPQHSSTSRVPLAMAKDHYATLGVKRDASAGRHPEGLSQAGAEVPSGHESGRCHGQEEVSGSAVARSKSSATPRNASATTNSASDSSRSAPAVLAGRGGPRWTLLDRPANLSVRSQRLVRWRRRRRRKAAAGLPICSSNSAAAAAAAARAAPAARGNDLKHELTVPFATAVLGGEAARLRPAADGNIETITVKIPAGIDDGKSIRLRGQGEPGEGDAPAGDILVTIRVSPHPYFRRTGNRLDVRVPVTLAEAALGAKIDVPTPQGTIALTVPPNTSSGKRLRIKGHGVRPKNGEPGDLFAEIQIVLPAELTEEERQAIGRHLGPPSSAPARGIAMVIGELIAAT